MRCLCKKTDGSQCTREASTNPTHNTLYCWQHQKCPPSTDTLSTDTLKNKTKAKQKAEKQTKLKADKQKLILHPSRQLQILNGPVSFLFYPNIQGKKILLLGDIHNIHALCNINSCSTQNDPGCKIYEVQQWLSDLATSSPQCLDIFVEHPYIKSQKGGAALQSSPNPLQAIRNQFRSCAINKIKCPPNLRYHYVDIRLIEFEGETIPDPLGKLLDIISIYGLSTQWYNLIPLYINQIPIIKEYYIGYNRTTPAKNIFYQFYQDLAKIVSIPYNQDSLDTEINALWKIFDKQLSKTTLNKNQFFQALLKVHSQPPIDIHGSLLTLPMDVYLLSRLFTQFDIHKMKRGPIGCHDPKYSQIHNAIIYAGDYHIRLYQKFIHQYFNILPLISKTGNPLDPLRPQCIKLDQPFDFFAL